MQWVMCPGQFSRNSAHKSCLSPQLFLSHFPESFPLYFFTLTHHPTFSLHSPSTITSVFSLSARLFPFSVTRSELLFCLQSRWNKSYNNLCFSHGANEFFMCYLMLNCPYILGGMRQSEYLMLFRDSITFFTLSADSEMFWVFFSILEDWQ